eukprot:scaffold22432_cov168-Amphora_coffeaeformis.AAC.23
MISTFRLVQFVFLVGCALTFLSLQKVELQELDFASARSLRLKHEQFKMALAESRPLSNEKEKTGIIDKYSVDGGNLEKDDSIEAAPESVAHDQESLLLNVSFYVYEDLLWMDRANVGDFSLEDWMRVRKVKHTDDYWFAKAALRHPMRTLNPEEAQLFVVPTMINEISDQLVWIRRGLCIGRTCDVKLLEHADEYLAQSKWFQRNQGRDHVVVGSHYIAHKIMQPFLNLAKCNVIGFEDQRWNDPTRLTLPSTYVGRGCPLKPKTHDFALVASMKDRQTHQRRANICAWLQDEKSYTVTTCGEGDQCPALSNAKFGWHVPGDTLGSQRLMDTILSGTVPIFTRTGQYDILPPWIDWDLISFYVDSDTPTAFFWNLGQVTGDETAYRYKLSQIHRNRNMFDWTTLAPFDTYMYVIARHVVPWYQTKANATRYNVLRLDRTENIKDPDEFVSCGNHEVPHCGLCAPGGREFLCSGQCRWCEFGAFEADISFRPADRCVPKGAICRPPDNLLVQPDDIVYDTEGWESSPIVLQEYKLIFFTTAKVACTTWKQLFRRMMGYENWFVEGTEDYLPWNPQTNGLKYLNNYDRAAATEMMTSPEWTRAIFLRDPKERLLSAFLDKVKKEPEVVLNTCCYWERDCISSGTTFHEFTRLAFQCQNEHWTPQRKRMEEKYWPYINFVGYMDSIAKDSRELLEKIGAWKEYGATGWGEDRTKAIFHSQAGSAGRMHATSARDRLKQYYTPDTELEVEEFYREDYMNPYTKLIPNRIFEKVKY